MGFVNSVSDAENILKSTGTVTPGVDKNTDVAHVAWDLSSLDYNAPGANGWLNRATGLTAIVNPLAWVQTLAGVTQNEIARNPDDHNPLSMAWKIGTGTLWGVLGGEMQGLGMIDRAYTSAVLGLGVGLDKKADIKEGSASNLDNVDVWDLSKTKDIGAGEAVAWESAGIARVLSGKTGYEIAKSTGLDWARTDFNIFDKTQSDIFEHDGQLNMVTQPLNFFYEVALDPSTYIGLGGGSVGKFLAKGAYGLGTAAERAGMALENKVAQDFAKGIISDSTRYGQQMTALAEGGSGYASQWLMKRGVAGKDLDSMSYLLGQTKTTKEANDVILAFNHGDEQATDRLVKSWLERNDGHSILALDSKNGGGVVRQKLMDPTSPIAQKPVLGLDELPVNNLGKTLSDYATQAEGETKKFLDNIIDLYNPIGSNGTERTALAINRLQQPVVNQGLLGKIPGLNTAMNWNDIKGTQFRATILENTDEYLRVGIASKISFLPGIVKVIRKGALTAQTGFVDLNDIGNVAIAKMNSYVNEADMATKGAISKSGKGKEFIDNFRAANTPEAKYQAVTDFEDHVWTVLSDMHVGGTTGVSKEHLQELSQTLSRETRIHQDAAVRKFAERKTILRPGEYTIESDDIGKMVTSTTNLFQTQNFKEVSKLIQRNGSEWYTAALKGKDGINQALQAFNTAWSFGILMRPARFLRERVANALGILLSGMAPQMWFNKDNWKSMQNFAYNYTVGAYNRIILNNQVRKMLYDIMPDGTATVPRGRLNYIAYDLTNKIGKISKNLTEAKDILNAHTDYLMNQIIGAGPESIDAVGHAKLEVANVIKDTRNENWVGVTSNDFTPEEGKFLATTESHDSANQFARQGARSVELGLSEADKALEIEQHAKNVAKSERNIAALELQLNKATRQEALNVSRVNNGLQPVSLEGGEVLAASPETIASYAKRADAALSTNTTDELKAIISDPNTPVEVIQKIVRIQPNTNDVNRMWNMYGSKLSETTKLNLIESGNIDKLTLEGLTGEGQPASVIKAAKQAIKDKNFKTVVDKFTPKTEVKKTVSDSSIYNVKDIQQQLDAAKANHESLVKDGEALGLKKTIPTDTSKVLAEGETVIDTYAQNILNQVNDGETVWFKSKRGNTWSRATNEDVASWNKQQINRRDIQILPSESIPQARKVVTYGETVSLTDNATRKELVQVLGLNNVKELDAMVASGEIRNNAKLIAWAENNHVGRIHIKENGADTMLTVPKFVERKGYNPAEVIAKERIEKGIDNVTKQFDAHHGAGALISRRGDLLKLDKDVEAYVKLLKGSHGVNYDEMIKFIADAKEQIAQFEQITLKMNERVGLVRDYIATKSQWRRRVGQTNKVWNPATKSFDNAGSDEYQMTVRFADGTYGKIAAPDYLSGSDATMIHDMTASGNSGQAIANNLERQAFNATGKTTQVVIPADAPMYHEALAGWLKTYGNDPAFKLMAQKLGAVDGNLEGEALTAAMDKVKSEIVDWLKNNPAGRGYAERVKLGTKYSKTNSPIEGPGHYATYEDFVTDRFNEIQQQLFDKDLLNLFNNPNVEIDANSVRRALLGKELKDVVGQDVGMGNMMTLKTTINKMVKDLNNVLVEHPQTVLENIPMAKTYYRNRFQELATMNAEKLGRTITKEGGLEGAFSAEELNVLRRRSQEYAINETRKWLYNVQSRTTATEFVGKFMPFFSAWTFTNRMLINAVKENPAGVFWLMSMGTKTVGDLNYVDSNGNPTDISGAASLIIPLPDAVRDVFKDTAIGPYLEDTRNVKINMKSLNVWYGGDMMPNSGPLVSIAATKLIQAFPVQTYLANEATKVGGQGIFNYVLPFGINDNIISQLSPSWLNQVNEILPTFFGDKGGKAYLNAYGKVMADEAGKYASDPVNYPKPTKESIESKVNALWIMKLFASTTSPASFTVQTEADMYRKIYLDMVKTYGQDTADMYFLQKHPEFVGATISQTKNPYSLQANEDTFFGLNKMPGVKDIFMTAGTEAKSLMGWAMNKYPNDTSYDQWYQDYLTNNAIGPGEDNYYTALSPSEAYQKAAAAPGWLEFRNMQNILDATANERNIPLENNTDLMNFRSAYIKELGAKYPEWNDEYKNVNPTKYNQIAAAAEEVVKDPNWRAANGSRSGVQYIERFLELRKTIQANLQAAGTSLNANKPQKQILDAFLLQAKKDSLEFSDWYNRYFSNDKLQ